MGKYLYYLTVERTSRQIAMTKFKIVYENKSKYVLVGQPEDVQILDRKHSRIFSIETDEGKEAIYKLANGEIWQIYLYENPNQFLNIDEIKTLKNLVSVRCVNKEIADVQNSIDTYSRWLSEKTFQMNQLVQKKQDILEGKDVEL